MKPYRRSKTVYSNARPKSVLPAHTRCQLSVNYSAAKRVPPRSELNRKRRPRGATFFQSFDARLIKRGRSNKRLHGRKGEEPIVKSEVCRTASGVYLLPIIRVEFYLWV